MQVYSFGEAEGRLYIASQLIPDGDLGQMLHRHGRPPARIAVNLISQVADGLADAHAAGLVHRDIKPANVLLRHRDNQLQAYLGDFGIARRVGADPGLTQAGGTVGTPSYMAPELHLGGQAGKASDIYSLGCLLWAALSGAAPYAGGTDYQTVMAHVEKPVPQLAATGPLAVEINRVLRTAMAKQPEQRYASAAAMRDDLGSRSCGCPTTRPPCGPAAPAPAPTNPAWSSNGRDAHAHPDPRADGRTVRRRRPRRCSDRRTPTPTRAAVRHPGGRQPPWCSSVVVGRAAGSWLWSSSCCSWWGRSCWRWSSPATTVVRRESTPRRSGATTGSVGGEQAESRDDKAVASLTAAFTAGRHRRPAGGGLLRAQVRREHRRRQARRDRGPRRGPRVHRRRPTNPEAGPTLLGGIGEATRACIEELPARRRRQVGQTSTGPTAQPSGEIGCSIASVPPSTYRQVPTMSEAASESRKAIGAAISSARPSRPMAVG